jgi:hypothetical protein
MDNQEDTNKLKEIYQEGFFIGKSGMGSNYLPYKYQNNLGLKKEWELGWRAGNKLSGTPQKKSLKSILFILVIIIVCIGLVMRFVLQKENERNITTANISSLNNLKNSDEQNVSSDEQNSSSDELSSNTLQYLVPLISSPSSSITTNDTKPIQQKQTTTTQEENPTELTETETETQTQPQAESEPLQKINLNNSSLTLSVEEAIFASSIIKKQPIGKIINKTSYIEELFFFTQLQKAIGQKITHQWYYKDSLISEKHFTEILGSPWRLHSMQKINLNQLGEWKVRVINSKGVVYHQQTIILE